MGALKLEATATVTSAACADQCRPQKARSKKPAVRIANASLFKIRIASVAALFHISIAYFPNTGPNK